MYKNNTLVTLSLISLQVGGGRFIPLELTVLIVCYGSCNGVKVLNDVFLENCKL